MACEEANASAGRFRARQATDYQGDENRSSARSCSCRGAREQRAAWSFCRRQCRGEKTWGFSRIREISRHQAQARNTPVKCEAAAAILASEGPAPVSVGRQHARGSCDFAQHVSERPLGPVASARNCSCRGAREQRAAWSFCRRRFAGAQSRHGDFQEYARFHGTRRRQGTHQ